MYTADNIDRRRMICKVGVVIGIIMILAGIIFLGSSNIDPSTSSMKAFFKSIRFQDLVDGDREAYYFTVRNEIYQYFPVYAAHQLTILCSFSGWLMMFLGALIICHFLYKLNDDTNTPTYVPTESIIKPAQNETRTEHCKATEENDTTWTCGNCQTVNSKNYGQCKKCGKFRG